MSLAAKRLRQGHIFFEVFKEGTSERIKLSATFTQDLKKGTSLITVHKKLIRILKNHE